MGSLFEKISDLFLIVFRSIKSVLTRNFMKVYTKICQKQQISREVTNGVNRALGELSRFVEKPSEKEDFYETKYLYISKNFVFKLILGILLGLTFAYFVLYPLAMQYIFTGRYCISDSRLADYNGDVIVYYDKEKTVPCYEGKLKDGKLEGEGIWYDAEGIPEYKGNFTEHMKSGKGEAYQNGELVYKGEFAEDAYEGQGELYEKGKLVFSGTFLGGQKDGEDCSVYYPNGRVSYRGTFTEGEQTGNGIAYYESGVQSYVGEFVRGKREGSGTCYDENGDAVYTGSFAKDVYDGNGILYMDGGFRMEGEFFEGVQGGDVVITRNGITFYEGGASDGVLNGQGVFYNSAGKIVYEGDVRGGTIDGRFLLGKSMDDVKACLGEAVLRESINSGGYAVLISADLGISVFFDHRSGEEESSAAYDVCLCNSDEMDRVLSMVLWSFSEDTDAWRKQMWTDAPVLAGEAEPQYAALAFETEKSECIIYSEENSDCKLWLRDGVCNMLQWTRTEGYVVK